MENGENILITVPMNDDFKKRQLIQMKEEAKYEKINV